MNSRDRDRMTRRMLKQYQWLKHAVEDADADVEGSQFHQRNDCGPVQSSRTSSITERGAFRHMSADYMRLWVLAINEGMAELEQEFPETAEILFRHFRMRYLAGYKHTHVAKMRDTICSIQHINVSEYYNRVNNGVCAVMFYAGEMGLFRNYSNIS